MGSFINADNVNIGEVNCYYYCTNNPVSKIDQNGNYDRDAAYNYAATWNGYTGNGDNDTHNPNFKYYSHGDDCINFVSQCVNAGGFAMNNAWHNKSVKHTFIGITWYTWDVTPTWSTVNGAIPYYDNHFIAYNKLIYTIDDVKALAKSGQYTYGDVAFIATKYDGHLSHAIFIDRVGSDDFYYAAHSHNRWDASVIDQYFKQCPSKKSCKMLILHIAANPY